MIAMLVFAVAPEFIRYVWSGKWDEAIFAVVVLAAGVPGIISTTFCVAILASKGLWKARLQGLGVLALGDALTAGVAAYFGDVGLVSVSVTLFRIVVATILFYCVTRILSSKWALSAADLVALLIPLVWFIPMLVAECVGSFDIIEFPCKCAVLLGTAGYYWFFVGHWFPYRRREN